MQRRTLLTLVTGSVVSLSGCQLDGLSATDTTAGTSTPATPESTVGYGGTTTSKATTTAITTQVANGTVDPEDLTYGEIAYGEQGYGGVIVDD